MWLLALTMLAVPPLAGLASRRRRPAFVLAALLLMATVWVACGGGGGMVSTSSVGTAPGSYNLRVTGTYTAASGATSSVSHSVDLTLTVN
jgi:ABC-type transporter Mla maintaining outer membrane lipid asymmetry permease subunit MlaE